MQARGAGKVYVPWRRGWKIRDARVGGEGMQEESA